MADIFLLRYHVLPPAIACLGGKKCLLLGKKLAGVKNLNKKLRGP
jgi:hypothetical protein